MQVLDGSSITWVRLDLMLFHTEEDFDALIIMMKRLRRTLLEESKNVQVFKM